MRQLDLAGASYMNKRVAKKVLQAGVRRYTPAQCWKAILRLCGYTILPPTPPGWTLICWMTQHGINVDNIVSYDDSADGSVVRSWGQPRRDCHHPAGNGWCNPHLISMARISPELLATDHELRALVAAGLVGP